MDYNLKTLNAKALIIVYSPFKNYLDILLLVGEDFFV